MKYSHTSLSNTGLKRSDNEDALGIFEIEDGLLAVVCDGLGGNKAGEIASSTAVDTIHITFSELKNTEYLERIKQSIIEANRVIMEKSSNDPDLKGMATTAEVLFLKGDAVYWGHVGDSRIYTYKNGTLKQLTKEHSLVQKLVDEGFLTLKEAENHPNKNIILRALGDSFKLEADLSRQKLNRKDKIKFFICTDGVTTVMNDAELEEILRNEDQTQIISRLSSLIEERGAPDNYSFVIITKID